MIHQGNLKLLIFVMPVSETSDLKKLAQLEETLRKLMEEIEKGQLLGSAGVCVCLYEGLVGMNLRGEQGFT